MNQRELFFRHVAQTSPAPLTLEIVKAEAARLYDAAGKEYIDLIGGISVANTGHRHPAVVKAIKEQLDAYLHIMVYGEFVETPQVRYAQLLTRHLPAALDSVYFTNSGAEAVEGAMKLAKRIMNRPGIIAFDHSYHGSTQGALSIIGSEYWRNAFRPLLPGISHLKYGSFQALDEISADTACVIAETVQAEAGVIPPSIEWMQALRQRCNETGTLLILDEIQTGFGRTGKLWGFENFGIVPDILLLGKALGGGMPLGAFTGAVAAWVAYKPHFDATTDADLKLAVFCTAPAIRHPLYNILTEIIGGFALLFGALALSKPASTMGALDALPVALLVLGIGLSLGGPTGYAINPARDLAPRIAHFILPIKGKRDSDWAYAWIPVLGPIIGGLIAAKLFSLL